MEGKRTKAQKRKKVIKRLKVKRIPEVFKLHVKAKQEEIAARPTQADIPPAVASTLQEAALEDNSACYPPLPEPMSVLVHAVATGRVKEIVLEDPDPSLWQQLKTWFAGE